MLVSCSEADRASALLKREPKLIVEVLSPCTVAYDRGEKFARYRRIATLEELACIDLDTRRTDVHRKGPDGLWVLHPFEAGESVTLASVERSLSPAILFAEID